MMRMTEGCRRSSCREGVDARRGALLIGCFSREEWRAVSADIQALDAEVMAADFS